MLSVIVGVASGKLEKVCMVIIHNTPSAAIHHKFERDAVRSFNTVMAAATCWARIEGKRHYPSDVMAGYAFGSFVSGVVYDTLINYDPDQSVAIIPQKDKFTFTYTLNF